MPGLGQTQTSKHPSAEVRSAPINGHRQRGAAGPISAINRHQLGRASRQNALALPSDPSYGELWIARHGARAGKPGRTQVVGDSGR